jgi:SH3-like domain-containing protein
MAKSVGLCCANMLYTVQRFAAWGKDARPLILAGALLTSLTLVTSLWSAAAETTAASLSDVAERTGGLPRYGTVTKMSNLRASPSMQGAIVAIARDGMAVEVLSEHERWYHVRNKEGLEAWIYKSLVLIEPESREGATATPSASTPPHSPEVALAPTAQPDIAAESSPQTIQVPQDSDLLPLLAVDESTRPSGATESGGVIEAILPYVPGLSGYLIIGLVVVLVLSIALQLRASRQLSRAMQEMGQILDIVEEIYADGTRPQPSGSQAPAPAPLAEAPTSLPQHLMMAFTPVEGAVLAALSDQQEVQEGELGKILEEKGFAAVLIKAVIGDIVRKTGTVGLPWVEVRYVQGRYSYRLRTEALSSPDVQHSES